MSPAAEPPSKPRAWLVRNAVKPVWVRLKAVRDEIDWDQALDDEVANRCWAYQHPAAAARDFSVSFKAYVTRQSRLELPLRDRSRLVEHYDPSVIEANIAAHGYVKRQCLALKGWWFWGKRSQGASYSKRAKRTAALAGARRYAAEAVSVMLPAGNLDFAF